MGQVKKLHMQEYLNNFRPTFIILVLDDEQEYGRNAPLPECPSHNAPTA